MTELGFAVTLFFAAFLLCVGQWVSDMQEMLDDAEAVGIW